MRIMKKIFWVEKLGVFEIVAFVLRSFFPVVSVKYDENKVSLGGKRLLTFLNKINLCKNFSPANLLLGKNTEGFSLSYIRDKDLDACWDEFCESYIPNKTESYKRMLKAYVVAKLYFQVSFILMVVEEIRRYPEWTHELILLRHPETYILVDYYDRKRGLAIRSFLPDKEYLKYFLKPLFYVFQNIISRIIRRKIKSNIIHC